MSASLRTGWGVPGPGDIALLESAKRDGYLLMWRFSAGCREEILRRFWAWCAQDPARPRYCRLTRLPRRQVQVYFEPGGPLDDAQRDRIQAFLDAYKLPALGRGQSIICLEVPGMVAPAVARGLQEAYAGK
ncbi:MAG: hypothetical protein AMXMBFR33_57850 [Candidatus Xenobia bacterium]